LLFRDTVDSVGLVPKRLPFTSSNTIVKTFRHAVALDERRAKFKANLWNRPSEVAQQLGINLHRRQHEFFNRHKTKTHVKEKEVDGDNHDDDNDEHHSHAQGTYHQHSKLSIHRGTKAMEIGSGQGP
jgi:uncharacterized protein (DUF2235 family)